MQRTINCCAFLCSEHHSEEVGPCTRGCGGGGGQDKSERAKQRNPETLHEQGEHVCFYKFIDLVQKITFL